MRSYYHKSDAEQLDGLLTELVKSSNNEAGAIVNELLEMHISTKERLFYRDEFNKQIERYISTAKEIIDIGSGVYPLMFPWDKATNLSRYVAIEKNESSVTALNAYAKRFKRYELQPYEQ